MKTIIHLWYLAQLFLEWEMLQTNVLEKIKTHILCSITSFRKPCSLWDNVEKYGRARQATEDNIMRRMRIERWITKATYTHWELCNTYCFSTATMVARTRLNVIFTLCCLCCNIIFCPSRFSKWTFQVFRWKLFFVRIYYLPTACCISHLSCPPVFSRN